MPDLLLIEDNELDVLLTQAEVERAGQPYRLHVARDGAEGLAFLRGEGSFAGAPMPAAVLLDLHMPLMDGFAVLRAIRESEQLRSLFVIVLLGTQGDEDYLRSLHLAADAYLVKPVQVRGIQDALSGKP